MVTAAEVEDALRGKLHATDVVRLHCCGSGCGPARGTGGDRRALAQTVLDTSGGCGASFDVGVVSAHFEGKRLLERHRLINGALEGLMSEIHALSIKRCWTPQQAAEKH